MFSTLIAALFAASAVALPNPDPAAAAAVCRTNTFKTGAFEMGTIAPWQQGGNREGGDIGLFQPGYKSNNCAQLVAPSPNGGPYADIQMFQNFNLCKGIPYTLSFFYKLGANYQQVALSVTFGGQQVYQSQSFPNGTTWTKVTANYTPTQAATGINFDFLNFQGDSNPYLLVDNIVVKKATS